MSVFKNNANAQSYDNLPPFYRQVTQMKAEGRLGQIIKKEEIETPIAGARAWRIAYISSDVEGKATISTGLIMAPEGAASVGGRPIVAWAHGTTGANETAGPSQLIDPAQELNEYFLVGGNSYTDYGLPSITKFIEQGYVVVGTDYQGLGGGGKHQYAVAATNGRDVINSVRAAGSMEEVGGGSKAVVLGWSQGGGAALAAASLKDYINQTGTVRDGIEFVGFVGLAPSDIAVYLPSLEQIAGMTDDELNQALVKVNTTFNDNIFDFIHWTMLLYGTSNAFPEQLKLTDVFTEEGAKDIAEIYSKKGIHGSADTINYTYGKNYASLYRKDVMNGRVWITALVKGSVEPVAPVAPVIIYWGTDDTVCPPAMGKLYRDQMCAKGATVQRVQLAGQQTHFSTPGASAEIYQTWIADRFAGKPVTNDVCVDQVP